MKFPTETNGGSLGIREMIDECTCQRHTNHLVKRKVNEHIQSSTNDDLLIHDPALISIVLLKHK